MIQKSQLIASFNGITDLIIILDTDYNIIFANKAFCKFYNIENSEKIIGQKCYEIIHNESGRCNKCPTQKMLESGSVITVEKKLRGEILKYWVYPVYNGKNTIDTIVSCSRIITDQKRVERELIHSEKLKGIGQLAAGAAHEINNPLCSILGYSELVLESISRTDPLYKLLSDIIESVRQAKKIIDGLLEYSRQSVTHTDYYDVDDVVNKAITLIKYKQRVKKISINFRNGNSLPKVKLNMQKTVQMFLNIISNAIDASPEKGTILISTQRYGENYISATVRDYGCGIPKENISHIFNPFFTTKEIGKGTGLGLSIAHSIVEQQNGKIRVESESGKGSTFEILFPVEDKNMRV